MEKAIETERNLVSIIDKFKTFEALDDNIVSEFNSKIKVAKEIMLSQLGNAELIIKLLNTSLKASEEIMRKSKVISSTEEENFNSGAPEMLETIEIIRDFHSFVKRIKQLKLD